MFSLLFSYGILTIMVKLSGFFLASQARQRTEHHERDSSTAPPLSEACFSFELGVMWGVDITGARHDSGSRGFELSTVPLSYPDIPRIINLLYYIHYDRWIIKGVASKTLVLLAMKLA